MYGTGEDLSPVCRRARELRRVCVLGGALLLRPRRARGIGSPLGGGDRTAVRVSHLLTSAGPLMPLGRAGGVMWGPEGLKSCRVAHLCLAHPTF